MLAALLVVSSGLASRAHVHAHGHAVAEHAHSPAAPDHPCPPDHVPPRDEAPHSDCPVCHLITQLIGVPLHVPPAVAALAPHPRRITLPQTRPTLAAISPHAGPRAPPTHV